MFHAGERLSTPTPPSFYCSISWQLMRDPVCASDGHTYERNEVARWLASNSTSPTTGKPLAHKALVRNHALRNAIEEHLQMCVANGNDARAAELLAQAREPLGEFLDESKALVESMQNEVEQREAARSRWEAAALQQERLLTTKSLLEEEIREELEQTRTTAATAYARLRAELDRTRAKADELLQAARAEADERLQSMQMVYAQADALRQAEHARHHARTQERYEEELAIRSALRRELHDLELASCWHRQETLAAARDVREQKLKLEEALRGRRAAEAEAVEASWMLRWTDAAAKESGMDEAPATNLAARGAVADHESPSESPDQIATHVTDLIFKLWAAVLLVSCAIHLLWYLPLL